MDKSTPKCDRCDFSTSTSQALPRLLGQAEGFPTEHPFPISGLPPLLPGDVSDPKQIQARSAPEKKRPRVGFGAKHPWAALGKAAPVCRSPRTPNGEGEPPIPAWQS